MARAASSSGPASGKPRRGTLREEQKNFTRKRLLESAVQVFEERGFDDATVDEIAAGAGASRATFYLHFKSKADIVDALVEQIAPDVEAYYSALDEALTSGSREDIRNWIKDDLRWFSEHETVVLAIEHIMMSSRATAADFVFPYTDYMPRFLESWPESRRLEAKLRVSILVALVARVHMLWRTYRLMPDVDEDMVIDVLTDLWAAGLAMGKSDDHSTQRRRRPARRAPTSS
jgi:AcrR family transcriptional regulator